MADGHLPYVEEAIENYLLQRTFALIHAGAGISQAKAEEVARAKLTDPFNKAIAKPACT